VQKLGLNFNLLRKDLARRKYNFYATNGEQPVWGTYLLISRGYLRRKQKKRLKKYGYNRVKERSRLADWEILLNQFKNPYIILLLFTAMLSTFLGETTDALIIVGIVLTGGLLDFWQERQAHRAVEKLLSMVKVRSSVIRDGKEMEIPVEEIVPEDIVILRAGDIVPAEGVLIKEKDLFVNEALMTGEAYPVEKKVGDYLYMATHVVSGFGIMKVFKNRQRYRIRKDS